MELLHGKFEEQFFNRATGLLYKIFTVWNLNRMAYILPNYRLNYDVESDYIDAFEKKLRSI